MHLLHAGKEEPMLSKLTFEQISKYWEVIEYAIENSLPPITETADNPEKMQNILASLMNGSMQCWASYKRLEGGNKMEGILVTTTTLDYCSGTKSLLLYSVYAYEKLEKSSWLEGFEAIGKYARSIGCHTITAVSNSEDVIRAAKMVGGDASYTLLVFKM